MNFHHSRIVTDILLLDVVGFWKLPDSSQFEQHSDYPTLTVGGTSCVDWCAIATRSELGDCVLPTGDGFYFILHPALAGYGPLLALTLRNAWRRR